MYTYLLILIIIIVISVVYYWYNKSQSIYGNDEHDDVYGGYSKKFEGDMREFYMGSDWFAELVKGNKTLDIRPGALERYKEFEGKVAIYFHGTDSTTMKINRINHYNSINDMLATEDWKKIGPHLNSAEDLKRALNMYFSDDRVKELGGINVFYLEKANVQAVAKKKSATQEQAPQKQEVAKAQSKKQAPKKAASTKSKKPATKKGKRERRIVKGGDEYYDYDYDNNLDGEVDEEEVEYNYD